jgi:hypothetical protein
MNLTNLYLLLHSIYIVNQTCWLLNVLNKFVLNLAIEQVFQLLSKCVKQLSDNILVFYLIIDAISDLIWMWWLLETIFAAVVDLDDLFKDLKQSILHYVYVLIKDQISK